MYSNKTIKIRLQSRTTFTISLYLQEFVELSQLLRTVDAFVIIGVVVPLNAPIDRENGTLNPTSNQRVKVFPVVLRHGENDCGGGEGKTKE